MKFLIVVKQVKTIFYKLHLLFKCTTIPIAFFKKQVDKITKKGRCSLNEAHKMRVLRLITDTSHFAR